MADVVDIAIPANAQPAAEALGLAHALRTNPKVLTRLRERTPVARSTVLKLLRRFAGLHEIATPANEMIVDTRPRQ